jgi:hypothetical protein
VSEADFARRKVLLKTLIAGVLFVAGVIIIGSLTHRWVSLVICLAVGTALSLPLYFSAKRRVKKEQKQP